MQYCDAGVDATSDRRGIEGVWEWGNEGTFVLDGRAPVGRVREQRLSPVGQTRRGCE